MTDGNIVKVLYISFNISGIIKQIRIENEKALNKFKKIIPEAIEISRSEVEEYYI